MCMTRLTLNFPVFSTDLPTQFFFASSFESPHDSDEYSDFESALLSSLYMAETRARVLSFPAFSVGSVAHSIVHSFSRSGSTRVTLANRVAGLFLPFACALCQSALGRGSHHRHHRHGVLLLYWSRYRILAPSWRSCIVAVVINRRPITLFGPCQASLIMGQCLGCMLGMEKRIIEFYLPSSFSFSFSFPFSRGLLPLEADCQLIEP